MGVECLVYPGLPRVFGQGAGENPSGWYFFDNFARADGAIGNGWDEANWTLSSGKALNTPTLGAELLQNPGFETLGAGGNDVWANWVEAKAGASVLVDETTNMHAGSHGCRMDIDASTSSASISQTVLTAENWYKTTGWSYSNPTGKRIAPGDGGSAPNALAVTLGAVYAQWGISFRRRAGAGVYQIKRDTSASSSLYIDDVSCKLITLAELFCTRDTSRSDIDISVVTDSNTLHQWGIVAALDDTATPANYLLLYWDGVGSVRLEKVVGGVYSALASAGRGFVAGAALRLVKSGTSVAAYYNNTIVGTVQTVNDAGIVDNTRHGLFSTDPSSLFTSITMQEVS